MKTVKTCELIGAALDWATAKADVGYEIDMSFIHTEIGKAPFYCFSPSTRWDQGGPLIEKYKVDTVSIREWEAMIDDNIYTWIIYGPTPLIAACRAIVASKLGGTVQIPDELWTAENDTAPPSGPNSENVGPAN